ncbi:hypothetical protein LDO31_15120 [Luteimonas sp. XNQY3]|nr:hypothetical protein [Luteimonas sp. XNQY3]MCD9007545.1 hypothetical protein [Luteimonas sp. XNQY3]
MTERSQAPLDKAGLQARIDALWREELEWVRRHREPDMSDLDAEIGKELERRDVHALPALDIAMWPEDVFFTVDVSDPERFNDRFMELPMGHIRSSAAFIVGMHHVLVLFILSLVMVFPAATLAELWPLYAFGLLLLAPLFWFCFRTEREPMGRVRYNRQAQLLHIDDGKGHVAHIPWRHVRPLVDERSTSVLKLYAPRPRAEIETYKLRIRGNPNPPPIDLSGPYECVNSLPDLYELQGLEFIRRYMAHGLPAIQPHPSALAQGLVKATDHVDVPTRWAGKYLLSPLRRYWHALCLGPWLDERARLGEARFEWNDEVKQLCGRSPNLRGLDARPIKPNPRAYYRPAYDYPVSFSYRLVNRHGLPLMMAPESMRPKAASKA